MKVLLFLFLITTYASGEEVTISCPEGYYGHMLQVENGVEYECRLTPEECPNFSYWDYSEEICLELEDPDA